MPIDDAKKISKLNAPGFNELVIAWEAWKERHKIKCDQEELAKNPSLLKLVFFFGTLEFQLLE